MNQKTFLFHYSKNYGSLTSLTSLKVAINMVDPTCLSPLWKITYASYSKLFKELKNGIEILVGQAVFKIKTVKMLFGSITQEPLGLP